MIKFLSLGKKLEISCIVELVSSLSFGTRIAFGGVYPYIFIFSWVLFLVDANILV